ncbi:MAG: hypothetical protein E6R09_05015 [Rhodocyclaceae bacterium]|jgi:hypothetical protein|nr:MAG: hypothetical protein E6R09_05015 [Rhodocyclaceae bacterium]
MDLFYELGLIGQISGTLGIISAFALIAITFPALPIAHWAQNKTAAFLYISPSDTIAYNGFWPRFLGVQASILSCTLILLLIIYLVSLGAKAWRNNKKS